MDDTTIEAQLAHCASIRGRFLATLRKSEKTTEECLTTLKDSEETIKKWRTTLRNSEEITKDCLATIRDLDEFTDNLKNRRFDKLEQMAKNHKNDSVGDGDDREDVNRSHTSFKRDRAVQQSGLLSLAPEIRNMIWKLCLFHPEGLPKKLDDNLFLGQSYGCLTMTINPSYSESRSKLLETYGTRGARRVKQFIREHSLRNLALMHTCQDVYNETAPFLWSQRFCFNSINHLQAFLFSDARLDLVRDIYVHKVDRQCGVSYMPAVCALLADKVKGLERFDVDMSYMNKSGIGGFWKRELLLTNDDLQEAGEKLGFDVYSCMFPWMTKVVHDQGIEKLMAILKIPRETQRGKGGERVPATNPRIHIAFKYGGKLSKNQREIADAAVAGEILRQVELYDK